MIFWTIRLVYNFQSLTDILNHCSKRGNLCSGWIHCSSVTLTGYSSLFFILNTGPLHSETLKLETFFTTIHLIQAHWQRHLIQNMRWGKYGIYHLQRKSLTPKHLIFQPYKHSTDCRMIGFLYFCVILVVVWFLTQYVLLRLLLEICGRFLSCSIVIFFFD